jgi:phosphoglycerate dehydrogenase-like enzyme
MPRTKVLIAESALLRLGHQLEEFSDTVDWYVMSADGDVSLGSESVQAAQCDIQVAWFSREVAFSAMSRTFADILLRSNDLQWIQTAAAGLNNPIYEKLMANGARLSNSNAQAPAIAEYVVANVLDRFQNQRRRRESQSQKLWQADEFRELNGSNWLIVGLGNIGQRIGRGVKGFDASVTGVRRSGVAHEAADIVITQSEIAEVLPTQDVVVLSCTLTEETRGMVDQQFLAAMKRQAILVNIGRGGLIDEQALLNSLDADKLDFAILDVFNTEPLPADSPFWSHPRVAVTPHASNRGSGTGRRGDELFLSNLDAFLSNRALQNEVTAA